MKIFAPLYRRVMSWSSHPYAPYYLFALSFAEAAFFPLPPDVLLAPMSLAKPKSAWWFALLTTLAAVLGAMLGYYLGAVGYHLVQPYLVQFHYAADYHRVEVWYHTWGFWLMLISGFVPIPFILFTLAAGATKIAFLPFVFSAFIGRGARFFLVAGLILWGGTRMESLLVRYIEHIGWIAVGFILTIYIIYKLT